MQFGTQLGAWMRTTSSHQRPVQLALAVTCGLLLGLLPKSSGLFFATAAVCYLLPAHLPLLALTAMVCSIIAPSFVEPLGQIGVWSLARGPLAPFWMRLDSLPIVPWLGIHNSIINGSLVVWLCASLPVFLTCWITARVMSYRARKTAELARESTAYQSFANSLDQTAEQLIASDIPAASAIDFAAYQELRPLSGPREPGESAQVSTPPEVVFSAPLPTREFELDKPDYLSEMDEGESHTGLDVPANDEIMLRAAQLAEWAEDLISEELKHDLRSVTQPESDSQVAPTAPQAELFVTGDTPDDQWLIETTMEVVRIAEQAVSQQAALKFKPIRDSLADATLLSPQADAITRTDSQPSEIADMSSAPDVEIASSPLDGIHFQTTALPRSDGLSDSPTEAFRKSSETIRRQQTAHSDVGSHFPAKPVDSDQPREEALRYLLRHLRGIQDKVQNQ